MTDWRRTRVIKRIFCVLGVALAVAACSSSSKSGSGSQPTSQATTGSATTGSAGSAATGSTGSAATGSPIVIGGVCSCTGPLGNFPNEMDAYKAWVDTVNASGGINGHQVKFISIDDQGNPGNSEAAVKTLVQSDHAIALVDLTNLDEGWASYVQSANVPVIGAGNSTTPFFMNPDFYPEGQTEDALFASIIEAAKAAGASNLELIYCAEAVQCQEGIAPLKQTGTALGLPVTIASEVSASAPNYTAQCVTAQQAHVTAVFVADIFTVVNKVAANCAQQGYHPKYIVDGLDLAPNFTSVNGDLYAPVSNLPYFASTSATQTMNAAFDQYFPGLRKSSDFNEQFLGLWASGLLLQDAAKAGGLGANGSTPTSAQLIQGLQSLKGDTLDGLAPPLTFAAGQPHPVHCWFESAMHNGAFTLTQGTTTSCEK
jgi:branched-chain amino acid transport system substrate-binding protein